MEPQETKNLTDPTQEPSGNSLESDSGSLETSEATATPSSSDATVTPSSPPSQPNKPWFKRLAERFNLYLLGFIFVVIVAALVVLVAFVTNHANRKPSVQTSSLSDNALKQLAQSDVTVGQPKQVLNVQGNAVFAGKVLINDSLDVAGPIQVGGTLSIPGITVSGNSVFDQVQINKGLGVAGDSAFQGQLSIQKNLTVAGGGTFGGALSVPQLTANTLQLNGDLNLTHHITAGGATPGRSNGGALGSGGSASVSGSDTAGSININTGSGASAGCLVTINFVQKYNATPHVLVTPIGSAAGSSGYYVTRTTSSFSVCANSPPSSASFGFDYFVLD